jgi:hypothetical protein
LAAIRQLFAYLILALSPKTSTYHNIAAEFRELVLNQLKVTL